MKNLIDRMTELSESPKLKASASTVQNKTRVCGFFVEAQEIAECVRYFGHSLVNFSRIIKSVTLQHFMPVPEVATA